MWLTKWRQRQLTRQQNARGLGAPTQRRHSFRPTVELLEDRTCPSNFTAATVSDLVADINAANLAGGANTITLVAGNTYSLTAVDNTTDGATGLPVIAANDNLTIIGNGDVIERSTATGTPGFRLLDVAAGASLTLQNLTLQGGSAFQGGAILNQGTLDLSGVTVQHNFASSPSYILAEGGGIFSNGALTLEGGSTIQDNAAIGGQGVNAVPFNRFFRGSHPAGPGGDAHGGGLYVAGGTATLTNVTLSANSAFGGRGGSGTFKEPFSFSTTAVGPGHGGAGLGGGLYVAGGAVVMSNVVASANVAHGGQGGNTNSVFSQPPRAGSGGNGLGAGLYLAGGTVTLRDDTVTMNSALGGLGGSGLFTGYSGLGEGGGLFIFGAVVYRDGFTQANTIDNTASTAYPNIYGTWRHLN